jgi:hypothetical protein
MQYFACTQWFCSKFLLLPYLWVETDIYSIDLLSSKLKFNGTHDYPSSRDRYVHQGSQPGRFTSTQKDDFAQNRTEHVVGVDGGTRTRKTHNDSTDHIIEGGSSQGGSINLEDMDLKGNVIKKTVEFRVV